jgi:Fic family protein
MEGLGFELRSEAHLRTLTEDVVQSSEIQGEKLGREQVRSSIARRLGMNLGGILAADRNVEGGVEMTMDATVNYGKPLDAERLFAWHSALFPTGRSGMTVIKGGGWRKDASGPMQVVSGSLGKQRVHYEAPPASRVPKEMRKFLAWFAKPGHTDPLRVAGLAHLWFVTIHPFDDGNGRIARAISDMALARSEGTGQRFYSMSGQIRHERNDYYTLLERTQKGGLDITAWQEWFLECLLLAIDAPTLRWPRRSRKRASGNATPKSPSTNGKSRCSTVCRTASRASSPRRNGRSSPKARRTVPTETSWISLRGVRCGKTRAAAEPPATRWSRSEMNLTIGSRPRAVRPHAPPRERSFNLDEQNAGNDRRGA